MKKFTFPLLLATALVLGACSTDDDAYVNPDEGKTAIKLGGASDKTITRAGFTGADTKLMIHYVSTHKATDNENFPYNDGLKGDGTTPKGTLHMASSATASRDASGSNDSYSTVTQTTGANGTKRYWDDAHGKNSLISLYAIAVPNKESLTNTTNKVYFDGTSNNAWSKMIKEGTETVISNDLPWVVSTTQTSGTIDDEDITYSNNVSSSSTIGFTHATKQFETASGAKSLVFNHALSRITINVKKGAGFGEFSSEFNIEKAILSKQTTAGTLNVATGTWTSTAPNQNVTITGTKVDYIDGENKLGYTFSAQVLPNVDLKGVNETMLTFVVDGNNYEIKASEIYDAIIHDNTEKETIAAKLNAGYNYKLNVTIKKSAIEITSAKLVAWQDINGNEQTPSNAIALETTMESSAGVTTNVVASDIYRSTALANGYVGNKNTLAADGHTLGATWYWPDNNTYYNLRTISPQNISVTTNAETDQITMNGGEINDATNDYIWGAPLLEKHGASPSTHNAFTYSTTNGYYDYLHPAIGPTSSEIHITQFHMTSKIAVKLTTSTGDDAVNLSDATVQMIGHKTTGTLNLGNALITPTGEKSTGDELTIDGTHSASKADFTWRTIPQNLDGVTFMITAQGNIYYVTLNTVLDGSNAITSWLPGKSYVYQFKITKSPIVITSAKLVDWNTITGTIKDITLEEN